MIERRALPRQKTFIKGRLYFNNRLNSTDCIIRDVTEKGARLEVPESVAIPDAFELYVPNRHEQFQARIEWRRGGTVGVTLSAESASKRKAAESASKRKSEGEGARDQSLADRVAKLEETIAALQARLEVLEDA